MSEEPTPIETAAAEAEEPRTAWQEFVRRQEAALDHAGKAIRGLFPDAAVEHWNTALDEFGKGMRVLAESIREKGLFTIKINTGRGEEDGDDEKPSTTGKKKVKIDVE